MGVASAAKLNLKEIFPFQGYCTPTGLNSPKTINTLENTARVTIEGEFVSKKEAVGKYQIHEPGCHVIKFKAKYEPE